MSYFFGMGKGHLSTRYERIAEKHGAELINHTDPQCSCGYGCDPHECRASRRHWFQIQPQLGEPHDSNTANAVMSDVSILFT